MNIFAISTNKMILSSNVTFINMNYANIVTYKKSPNRVRGKSIDNRSTRSPLFWSISLPELAWKIV